MQQELAFFNGRFCAPAELTLPIDDLGVLQGVAVSERLRTFRGVLFRPREHLRRLENSLRIINLQLHQHLEQIHQIAQELVRHNHALLRSGDDLGLALFATPGRSGQACPTLGIHTYPLPFAQWVSQYKRGQALTETKIRQVPDSCWPASLKCRSRMHYYLADLLAGKEDPGSRAVLLDQDGCVSEASTANIVFYSEEEGLVSPPREQILPGVSLSVLDELAGELQIPMTYRNFRLDELARADEILLCSTSPCVWPVTRLNRRPAGRGAEGAIYRTLLAAWSDLVGLDIVAQAGRFADRPPSTDAARRGS